MLPGGIHAVLFSPYSLLMIFMMEDIVQEKNLNKMEQILPKEVKNKMRS